MIDPADKKTAALPLDEQPAKRKRGRPATGAAMTPAEKQRAYRERQKQKAAPELGLKGALENWETACRNLGATKDRVKALEDQVQRLQAVRDELISELRAEKANKGNVTQKANAVFVLQTKKGNSWKDSEICYYSTMRKAENALKSLGDEGKNKEMWRIRQRQFL